jgi:hypothetical protein
MSYIEQEVGLPRAFEALGDLVSSRVNAGVAQRGQLLPLGSCTKVEIEHDTTFACGAADLHDADFEAHLHAFLRQATVAGGP